MFGWQKKAAPLPGEQQKEYRIHIDRDGEAPPILSQLVRYLHTKGAVEKIFQITPPAGKELQTLQKKLNSEREALLLSSYTKNPHVVAELTKLYLSSLREPLLTFDFYDRIMLVGSIKTHKDRMKSLKQVLLKLPRGYYSTVSLMLSLLSMIANTPRTQMTASSLADIFSSWFLRPSYTVFYREEDKPLARDIVEWLIYEYDYLIKNTRMKGISEEENYPVKEERAPPIPREPSIRYQDISKLNQNRKPIYYVQQVKEYEESQNKDSGGTVEHEKNNSEPNLLDKVEEEELDTMEEEEEETEFNEEESRKTDEMMGVIDAPEETVSDIREHDELLSLELQSDNVENAEPEDGISTNSMVLLPKIVAPGHSEPMLPKLSPKHDSIEDYGEELRDSFELVMDESDVNEVNETNDSSGLTEIKEEGFEEVDTST